MLSGSHNSYGHKTSFFCKAQLWYKISHQSKLDLSCQSFDMTFVHQSNFNLSSWTSSAHWYILVPQPLIIEPSYRSELSCSSTGGVTKCNKCDVVQQPLKAGARNCAAQTTVRVPSKSVTHHQLWYSFTALQPRIVKNKRSGCCCRTAQGNKRSSLRQTLACYP